jgi:hypothetical protein
MSEREIDSGNTVRLKGLTDNRVMFTAVETVPKSQMWTLAEPHRSRIKRGLTWAAQAKPRETNIETLLKRAQP